MRNIIKVRSRLLSVCASALALGALSASTDANFSSRPLSFLYSLEKRILVLEDGRDATNHKVLKAAFDGLPSQSFTQMRIAEESQFSDQLPWVPYAPETRIDLGPEWDVKGDKDGVKTVRAQLGNRGKVEMDLSAKIILDTVPPSGSSAGIMATGLEGGQIHAPGDKVTLEWLAEDVPSPVTGSQSGLDPKAGARVGWSRQASCEETNLTQSSEWMPNATRWDGFGWPSVNPAESFYVCVVLQDRAGNRSTVLSQPMTGRWRILAGDNNQGNGGSATARNVRFNHPGAVAVDSKRNIYIYDDYFQNLRRISPEGIITVAAGNGQGGGPVEGPALKSPFSYMSASMAVDSQDRVYMVYGWSSQIWRFIPDPDPAKSGRLQYWGSSGGGITGIAVDPKTDSLYIAATATTGSDQSGSYILKASIAAVDAQYPAAARPDGAYLRSCCTLAGNGRGTAGSVAVPTLLAATDSVDYASTVAYGDRGEVYFSTTVDGVGSGYGHAQVRVLRPGPDGTLKNYLIKDQLYWIGQMQFVHGIAADRSVKRYLLVANNGGLHQIDVSDDSPYQLDERGLDPGFPLKTLAGGWIGGVGLFPAQRGGEAPEVIYSHSDGSRVVRLNADLSPAISYGRAVYDPKDKLATEAMINNPSAVIEANDGSIYFFETLSYILRKISPSGRISVAAGKPGVPGGQDETTVYPFSEATFRGGDSQIGYQYQMVYDDLTNVIYLTNGWSDRITRLDLTAKTASTYAPSRAPGPGWPIFGLALSQEKAGSRFLVEMQFQTWLAQGLHFGGIYKLNDGANPSLERIAGNASGDTGPISTSVPANQSPLPWAITGTVMDSRGNYYLSAGSGLYSISPQAGARMTFLAPAGFGSMVLFEEEDGSTHIFGLGGNGLYHVQVGSPQVDVLSVTGTSLNAPRQLSRSRDGNLLIADSANSRILKYFIRDSARKLSFH